MSSIGIRDSVMKFTLMFEGHLPSNGSPKKQQLIREYIHPQLGEMWNTHPSLKTLTKQRHVTAQSAGLPLNLVQDQYGNRRHLDVDLCSPIEKRGISFLPIVRQELFLKCSLSIMFLRKEEPGKIFHGGDLDNRIKTLLDALTVPQNIEQVCDPNIPDRPICCLLANDALITGLDIQTKRLLGRSNDKKTNVTLIIDVDVRVANPRIHNQMFLGD